MRIRSGFSVLLVLALASCQSRVRAAAPADSTPQGPTQIEVIELFTSEGCSSCPPADELLGKIHLKRTSDGQVIVGISEHVTYWNSQGWKDPFSAEVFTDRQSVYASRLSPEGPYTPQMVVNGQDQLVGSDAAALVRTLKRSADRPHLDLEIISTAVTRSGLDLRYALKSSIRKKLDIVAVITDDADRSQVLRGENSGRSLDHVSVARMLVRVGTVHSATEEATHLTLPSDLDLAHGSGHHLILFAQQQQQGAIVGAAIKPI